MDINEKIAANLGLVYQQLIRFNLKDDQDAESFAYEALYKAIITYDDSAAAFSTYATCVIANTLRMHIRKMNKKRQLEVISYDTPISDEEGADAFVDRMGHIEDTESIVLYNELTGEVNEAFDRAYETLCDTYRRVIDMWRDSDYTIRQGEIAKALRVSQPTVSKALSIFRHRLKLELEEYL